MRIPVLMYHEISPAGRGSGLNAYLQKRYIVDEDIFDKQMAFLAGLKIRARSIADTVSADGPGGILLTFDDGYAGNFERVLPILNKYGFKAVIFVTAEWVGKPLMLDWEQVKKLSSAGLEIGSHTYSHAMLGELAADKVRFELAKSKEIIEKNIGREVSAISYPNGSTSPLVDKLAREAGYKYIFGSRFGYWDPAGKPQPVPRIIADNDLEGFARIVRREKTFVMGQKCWQALKAVPLAILGKNLYNKLYLKIFRLKEIK